MSILSRYNPPQKLKIRYSPHGRQKLKVVTLALTESNMLTCLPSGTSVWVVRQAGHTGITADVTAQCGLTQLAYCTYIACRSEHLRMAPCTYGPSMVVLLSTADVLGNQSEITTCQNCNAHAKLQPLSILTEWTLSMFKPLGYLAGLLAVLLLGIGINTVHHASKAPESNVSALSAIAPTSPMDMPACEQEDGAGVALCWWDAQAKGNGKGTSIISGDCAADYVGGYEASVLCVKLHAMKARTITNADGSTNTIPNGSQLVAECNDIANRAEGDSEMQIELDNEGWTMKAGHRPNALRLGCKNRLKNGRQ